MIAANHAFRVRSLNALDENGNEGCASCGRPRDVHPAPAVTPGQAQIVVNVTGVVVPVTPQPGWSIGAIATHARWQAGCGSVAFDNWEYRTRDGRLLDPSAPPGALDYLTVVRLAGIGA